MAEYEHRLSLKIKGQGEMLPKFKFHQFDQQFVSFWVERHTHYTERMRTLQYSYSTCFDQRCYIRSVTLRS